MIFHNYSTLNGISVKWTLMQKLTKVTQA